MSNLTMVFALLGVLLAFFLVGFFLWQKRFWAQSHNRSTTAPLTPEEGVGNNLAGTTKDWHPPKAA